MSTGSSPVEKSPGISSHVTETEFWDVLMHDVYGPRKGGAIIFLDAENARKGVAKTSGAVAIARLLSAAFGYDIKNGGHDALGDRVSQALPRASGPRSAQRPGA